MKPQNDMNLGDKRRQHDAETVVDDVVGSQLIRDELGAYFLILF